MPVFGLSNGYWLRAQASHDTEVAERALGATLTKIKPCHTPILRNLGLYPRRNTDLLQADFAQPLWADFASRLSLDSN